uniref:Peptidase S1 domain-containing protein n=1 Tax=Nelumbo nucifera TaxID=4432 RepID=A0A822Y607_NELNU|nr:TPA_asm: hypothetical protein HUJ06_028529 [Nelumbo nucifera]
MGDQKMKQGRKPKKPAAETINLQMNNIGVTSSANIDDIFFVSDVEIEEVNPPTTRKGRGQPHKAVKHAMKADTSVVASLVRKTSRTVENNGECHCCLCRWRSCKTYQGRPFMDAIVKVFCVHTEPNFSPPWQWKRQYNSSSSGFIINGWRVLTNAHTAEHHTQVKLKKRGSNTKYLVISSAIGLSPKGWSWGGGLVVRRWQQKARFALSPSG